MEFLVFKQTPPNWRMQFVRFAIVGAMGTGVHYITLIFLVSFLYYSAAVSAMIGATLGAITNYFLNYSFTFGTGRRHREAVPRFIAMAAAGVVLNGLFVETLTSVGLHYLAAQLFATLAILVLNFLLSRLWIFRKLP